MNLLTFIDLEIQKSSGGKSGSSRDKDAVCRVALKAFLNSRVDSRVENPEKEAAAADIDLRKVPLSPFLYDFGVFLATRYEKRYSPATCREILRTLRKWVRLAIAQGFIPNIDLMPRVIERLDEEFWSGAADAAPRKIPLLLRQDLKVRDAVARLSRFVDAWAIRRSMAAGAKVPKTAAGVDKERTMFARSAAIYLFSLFTYGIEIGATLAIPRSGSSPEVPDKVEVPGFPEALPLSPSARSLVKTYNRGTFAARHLFSLLDTKKYKDDPDAARRLIDTRLGKCLRRESIPLYRRQSVFIDWLNYAIECGLPDSEAETLWRWHLGEIPFAESRAAAEAAQACFTTAQTDLEETWYLLSVIPLSVRRDRFLKMFLTSGILGDEEESRRHVYAPEEKLRNKEKGEYAVFSRYIFFRATPLQAGFANSFSPYAYVLRERSDMKFARISHRDVAHLREMLRDFQDVEEMQDGKKWLEEHNAEILVGCKAVIRSGSLAGREATVVRIKGKQKDELTFILEFVEGALKFQTSLPGITLDLISC